jgi:hypothetical protein
MKKTKQIEEEIKKLRNELYESEQEEFNKIQVPFLKSLVGKCFSYKDNGYGGDSEKWNEYKKIVQLYTKKDGSVYLITENFHTDCYGKTELSTDYHYPYTNEAWRLKIPFSGYEKITNKEYENEKKKMLKQMSSFSKIKSYLIKED